MLAFCASVKPCVALSKSLIISDSFLVLPSLSKTATPNSLSFFVAFSFAPVRFNITVLKVVPACEPLIPASPNIITDATVSCIEKPALVATGAMYFRDSPRVSMLTLALLIAYARESEYIVASCADKPNAVKLSETMSATVANSLPDAMVKSSIAGKPAIISEVSQPAIARNDIASADSEADIIVVAPNSLAKSVSF